MDSHWYLAATSTLAYCWYYLVVDCEAILMAVDNAKGDILQQEWMQCSNREGGRLRGDIPLKQSD